MLELLPRSNITWESAALKWLIQSNPSKDWPCGFFCVCASTCGELYLQAHWLFTSLSPPSMYRWSSSSNNNTVPQPDELQPRCCLSLTLSFPHPSLRCRGYSRTWCGFWPVWLCKTDGPVRSLSASPPVCLLCRVQLHSCPDIYSYANMSCWLISPHTQVLCPYGTPQHPWVLLLFMCTWIGRGCGMDVGMSVAE